MDTPEKTVQQRVVQRAPAERGQNTSGPYEQPLTEGIVRRALHIPETLSPADVLVLQRQVGNAVVQRLVRSPKKSQIPAVREVRRSGALTIDRQQSAYEQEADRIATQIQRDTPAPGRQPGRRASVASRSPGPTGGSVGKSVERRIQRASGGQALPGDIRRVLEPRLAADLQGVKVHTGKEAVQLNRDLGADAFTYRNHIFYGQGQSPHNLKLTTHEVAHTLQQGAVTQRSLTRKSMQPASDQQPDVQANRNPGGDVTKTHMLPTPGASIPSGGSTTAPMVQRKTIDLPQIQIVSKKWKGLRKSKTQQMQSEIIKYNAIPESSTDYEKQILPLRKIVKLGTAWLYQHAPSEPSGPSLKYQSLEEEDDQTGYDEERYDQIADVVEDAEDELDRVEKQSLAAKTLGTEQLKAPEALSSKALAGVSTGLTGLGAYSSGSDASSLDQTHQQIGGGLKEWASKLFDDAHNTRQQAQQNFGEGDGVLEVLMNSAKGIFAYVTKFPIFQSLGFAKSLWTLYETIKDYLTFKRADKSLGGMESIFTAVESDMPESQEQESDLGQSLLKETKPTMHDPIKHGLSKVWRRVWSAMYDGVSATLGLISYFVAIAGGPAGAAFAAVVNIGKGLLTALLRAGRMVKGLYKVAKGTRGAHREESAATTVREALRGDTTALQLLLDLEVIGVTDRMLSKFAVKNPTTPYEMHQFLTKLSKHQFGTRFTMSNYMELLADRWKSFT